MRIKLYGPPGTGKTTTTIRILREMVKNKEVRAREIKALSFTKSAKWSLLEKGDFLEVDNVRTIHSFVWRSLKFTKDNILKQTDIKKFFESHGYEYDIRHDMGEDEVNFDSIDEQQKAGNFLYALINICKHIAGFNYYDILHRMYEKSETSNSLTFLTQKELVNIAKKLDKLMESTEKYDYTHGLLMGLKRENALKEFSGDVLVQDEYQDITPLQHAILKRVERNFKHVITAGDDDQAIFTWAGANPKLLIGWQADKEEVLGQSWRLPRKVWELGMRIITQNKNRVEKKYKPRSEEGVVAYIEFKELEDVLLEADERGESVLILARNNFILQDGYTDLLEELELPWRRLKQHNTKIPEWAKYAQILYFWHKDLASEEEIRKLVLTDEKHFSFRKIAGYKGQKEIKEWERMKEIVLKAMLTKDSTVPIVRNLLKDYLFWVDEDDREKWGKKLPRLSDWSKPLIRMGTIHQAKGLEADIVILDSRLAKKSFMEALDNPEPERRVLYTGITRTKQELYIVQAHNYPYTYQELGFIGGGRWN